MNQLNLHGVRHNDVEHLLHSFLYRNLDNLPVEVITGKSDQMRNIVKSVIKEYGFFCHNQHWVNEGCLIITDSEV
jgi:DNA-nicking Smr family endonuclease